MNREPLDPQVRVDPEVLAALLDGTLPAHERDEVLGRLARSPADYEAFVEAVSVLRELEDESGAAPVPLAPPPLSLVPPPSPPAREIRPARRRLPGAKLWLPLAAVLAGVMVVPRLLADPAPLELLDGRTLVLEPGDGSIESLGGEWNQPGWSVKRGGGAPYAEQHRDFRIGVRLAELDVALEAGDAQAVQRVEPELFSLFSQVSASGLAVDEYRRASERASRQGPGGEEERARALANLAALLRHSPWLGLGIWMEQARLAALAKQPRFFTASASGALEKLTDRVAEQQGGDAPLVQRLRSLRGLVDAVPRNGLGPVRSALPEIVREAGG